MRAEQFRTLEADGAVAERGAFRAASDDADVSKHSSLAPVHGVDLLQQRARDGRATEFNWLRGEVTGVEVACSGQLVYGTQPLLLRASARQSPQIPIQFQGKGSATTCP